MIFMIPRIETTAVPAYCAIVLNNCEIRMKINATIAEMIWLSVIAEANKPIEINMNAIKKKKY